MRLFQLAVFALLVVTTPAMALNYPCSKGKGGVERCEGRKFVCRDGSVSSSKKICTPELAAEFLRQWEIDNGQLPEEEQEGSLSRKLTAMSAASTTPTRVIDGDTIDVGPETFRLEGIDAPEMKQTCEDAKGKTYACGRRAKEALAALITGPVDCEKTGEDKYGRSLGYCRSGGVDLNRQMVAQGWALAFVKYNTRYVAEEDAARSASRGAWAGKIEPPWDWRAGQLAALAPKGECAIKGNISRGRKTYYLPFHLMYARVKVDEAKGERWFCTEAEASAAGWERAPR